MLKEMEVSSRRCWASSDERGSWRCELNRQIEQGGSKACRQRQERNGGGCDGEVVNLARTYLVGSEIIIVK
jgi:hypothetical protein